MKLMWKGQKLENEKKIVKKIWSEYKKCKYVINYDRYINIFNM